MMVEMGCLGATLLKGKRIKGLWSEKYLASCTLTQLCIFFNRLLLSDLESFCGGSLKIIFPLTSHIY